MSLPTSFGTGESPQPAGTAPTARPAPGSTGETTAPETGGGGTTGTGDDDLPTIDDELRNYQPDLAGLPDLEVIDFDAFQFESTDQGPLAGGGAVRVIVQACSDYGADGEAAVADALFEGADGGIGDNGTSYGPFQMRIGGRLPEPYASRGPNNAKTNAWAWSENGIRYAIRDACTIRPSIRGLTGHKAIYAWVYGFESPADKPGAYRARAAEYDLLQSMPTTWPVYAAARFAGPRGGGGSDTGLANPVTATPYQPAGVNAQWRGMVGVLLGHVPALVSDVTGQADRFKAVFK